MSATGICAEFIPADHLHQVLRLVRLGERFSAQQKLGRRPDYFTRYLDEVIRGLKPCNFAVLIAELELCAARREVHGVAGNPVEKIDRLWKLATLHHPKRGRVQLTFKTLRNKLMLAVKMAEDSKCPDLP